MRFFVPALFFLFFTQAVFAQQPACFVLGDEQFRGIQIYDVIQDKKLNYWFATNEGIYYYDYHSYRKVESNQAKSSSVFNFIMDREGAIYCHNLNNQIFRITALECRLFYELAGDEGKADISLSVSEENHLLIGAGKIIVLDKSGKVLSRFPINDHSLGPPFVNDTGAIQFHLSGCDSVLVYSKGKFTQQALRILGAELINTSVLKFFRIKGSSYALDSRAKNLFAYQLPDRTLTALAPNTLFDRGGTPRIYEAENEIWLAGTLPGVVFFTGDQSETANRAYYEDYFISDVYKDKEGNYLLSTFDKGVLVIPDLKVPGVIHSFSDDPVTALYAGEITGLILGSSKGKLMRYRDGILSLIQNQGKRHIEALYGSKESELVLFDDGLVRAYHKGNGRILTIFEASLKTVAFVNGHSFFLGTNYGIVRVEWKGGEKFVREAVDGVNSRVYSMVYQPENGHLYASTAQGLFRINPGGKSEKILYQNQEIFSEYLYLHQGRVYAITSARGILIIDKNEVTSSIQPMVNGQMEKLKRLVIYEKSIIASSSNGLFQFDLSGNLLRPLHAASGFTSKKVINFTLHKSELWVSHAGGVQIIDLKYQPANTTIPLVRIDAVLVNDDSTNLDAPGIFESAQRKVQVFFSSPTLRNRETLRYHYKLEGYDTEWNTHPFEIKQITYNALEPGNYTLYLKAENLGEFSTPVLYRFRIAPPWYTTWWFVSGIIAVFLFFVWMIYRWQLNLQRKKSRQLNELNASRLTAIQSQMNPHFIFNSLNSIQDLVLKGDVENSYSYITTFSDLVRRTLDYSEKDFIEFEEEIKLIEVYLSLEKLRFKKDFSYELEIHTNEDFLVPPMLIQPFIENALVHGLLHKKGIKKLKISFELNESLLCTIEDNGVGREKSKSIQERQKSTHASFSGKAIRHRFELLSSLFKDQFGYTYEDLYEEGLPCGTRVVLRIPVKHEF